MATISQIALGLIMLVGVASPVHASSNRDAYYRAPPVEWQARANEAYASACSAKDPIAEPTYMWLQDHTGGASWPLRPRGWQAGASCNPRGRYR
jgi:hypothetical protein